MLGVGIKSIYYRIACSAVYEFNLVPTRNYKPSLTGITEEQLWDISHGYLSKTVVLLQAMNSSGTTFGNRMD
ncbi:hypothetical protein ACE6H2_010535 [Prunus campanulata]